MSLFSAQEISNFFGRPTYLLAVTRDSKTWAYTSADRDITHGGRVYEAVPLRVGTINRAGDSQSDELTIEIPSDVGAVTTHVAVPPTERVQVVLSRYHRGGTDAAVRFVGQVDRIRRVTPIRAEMKCKSLLATYARSGARLSWQRGCTHALYDAGCKVNKDAYGVAGTVAAKDPTSFSATSLASLADGRFQGGYVEWTFEPGLRARRAITGHFSTAVSLLGGTYGLDVGMPFVAYPGCPRDPISCQTFYNNLSNYGGVPHLPSKSPFNGDPVF